MDLLIELKKIIEVFNKNQIDYALCGGLALAVYAKPRATLDIDIMVERDFLNIYLKVFKKAVEKSCIIVQKPYKQAV